ncbi:MAG TPA: hypothetical protein VHZ50_06525 [Puia sp.]|nr:hypothetical protein [Puia sp.]
MQTEILSDNWYTLKKITYEYLKKNGTKQIQTREAYDRGNGATILLFNKEQRTVILTKQFRLPTACVALISLNQISITVRINNNLKK